MKRTVSLVALGATLIVTVLLIVAQFAASTSVVALPAGGCQNLPSAAQLHDLLVQAQNVNKPIGGLFEGTRMWGAVVNRDGELCAYATSTSDPTQVWPGSQAIAKSKAYTANAFSLDTLPLSTARLYTFTQPGHSLWSLGQSNLFNTQFLAPPGGQGGGNNQIVAGLIFFGGGVPLYHNGKIVGGLGISGDTSCADHEIAKRVRDLDGSNPVGGPAVDDIVYSGPDAPSVFAHPVCPNTYRNGTKIGDEAKATYPFIPPIPNP
ncbi:MAG: heme-binding protein [Blastocatellia bacterium]|nr:MAG: heme-binding protein [Blastocatellia bacterium]